MGRKRQQIKSELAAATARRRRSLLVPAIAILAVATLITAAIFHLANPEEPIIPGQTITPDLAKRSRIPPNEAVACGKCHKPEFDLWVNSQHAWANRLVSASRDKPAFHPDRLLAHGSFTNTMRVATGLFEITTTGRTGTASVHHAEAVIGIEPLRQYLVPFPGGRLQVVDVSYDPRNDDWFNAQGDEDRQPNEWGYWKNRSMTWNVQCAYCHMTGLKKNYDPATDAYSTTWRAMGISCTQCHGTMPAHMANPKAPVVGAEKRSPDQIFHACGSCHSRREEITGRFVARDDYFDHYRPALPDLGNTYYPDGQVWDEDFEFSSFLTSRMGHKGVRCLDCHNPHSGKLILPVDNNALCMSCHTPPGRNGAIPIPDPVAHGHHKEGSTGNLCVECHMPITKYMVRDPRRDHGFTCPDPLLTKESGIPNACSRCHTDKSIDWNLEWAQNWYGARLERRSRQRARLVARARRMDDSAVQPLLEMARSEEIAAWRAAIVGILQPWSHRPEVRSLVEESLAHPSPMVRSAAVRILSPMPDAIDRLKPLQSDPSTLVRVDAAWAAVQQRASTEPAAYRELLDYINNTCDQPPGALRQAQLALAENRHADAEAWARKAASWDPTGAAHNLLARILHAIGKRGEAIQNFRVAMRLEPTSPDHPYALALLLAETGEVQETIKLLQKAVQLDPGFGRAWYNLGLGLAQQNRLEEAIAALRQAEKLMPESPDPAYARATIHLRLGDIPAAKDAARRALDIQPDHEAAKTLIQGADH
ncbi:MAG TPA: tetratricopeptide repeat protein [Verrucomicrobiae bacterium]|nr:tetratricopeptide repeat protein [Verrucomicrobiae bacterium]